MTDIETINRLLVGPDQRLVILRVKDSRRVYNTTMAYAVQGEDGKYRISQEAYDRLMKPVPPGRCVSVFGG